VAVPPAPHRAPRLRTPPRPGRPGRSGRALAANPERGYIYTPNFVDAGARAEILAWLGTLHPLWEQRYSTRRPPPPGKQQRALLRPVYWLGNCSSRVWATTSRRAAPAIARSRPNRFPRCWPGWWRRSRRAPGASCTPPTCHAAGASTPAWSTSTAIDGREPARPRAGTTRRGSATHRDFEPGPVASVSLGERALFQFVRRGVVSGAPVRTQWLDDGSLQVFAGPRWKDELLHRVQRVEDKHDVDLPPAIDGFRTRRVNFTFRYVPPAHVVPFSGLSVDAREDVRGYVETLARGAPFFARALAATR
jgi:alkylated DNA repair protein (DNA oxidative demethylase)